MVKAKRVLKRVLKTSRINKAKTAVNAKEFNNALILKAMRKPMSANQIINKIYTADIRNGLNRKDWKFYVHLNKLFAPLNRKGLIEHKGFIAGENQQEKVWSKVN